MNLHSMPEKNLLVLALESVAEAAPLAALPAWQAAAGTWGDGKLPLLAIDAGRGVAVLSAWDGGPRAPLTLIAPPLSGISRAVGLQLIFDAFGYRRFNRPFGPETVFANPAYVQGHGITRLAQVAPHLAAFSGALGIAALGQPRGTIWDIHAAVSPGPVLVNPNAHSVFLVRDPRDVVVSAYFFFKRTAGALSSLTAEDFQPARKEAALGALIADGFTSLSAAGFLHHPQIGRAHV